jgi:hypothetical protein
VHVYEVSNKDCVGKKTKYINKTNYACTLPDTTTPYFTVI